jgi:CDP-paratose 2-epimerase
VVAAYRAALARIGDVAGHAFNIGGGPGNAVSLLQLLDHVGALLGRPVERSFQAWRPGDQRYYVSDTRRAVARLGLEPFTGWRDGVADLAGWLTAARAQPGAAAPIAGAAA